MTTKVSSQIGSKKNGDKDKYDNRLSRKRYPDWFDVKSKNEDSRKQKKSFLAELKSVHEVTFSELLLKIRNVLKKLAISSGSTSKSEPKVSNH